VTARPRSRYVADLVGVNLLQGTARGQVIELDGGGRLHTDSGMSGPVLAAVNPAKVAVSREPPPQAGQADRANCWRGTIDAVDLLGDRVRVRMAGTPAITAEVPPSAVGELKLDDAGELWACTDPGPSRCTRNEQAPASRPQRDRMAVPAGTALRSIGWHRLRRAR
jgi:molybdate transport system ATP-binding protein